LSSTDLIKEQYTGIRPAPGYPACPDHTEKQSLFELLDVQSKTGITGINIFKCLFIIVKIISNNIESLICDLFHFLNENSTDKTPKNQLMHPMSEQLF